MSRASSIRPRRGVYGIRPGVVRAAGNRSPSSALSPVRNALLIDQPEEDLDSQIIQDVVTRLWIAKGNRQIIFASHNANLVVNGDAELVVVCDYRSIGDQSVGQIKTEGAIDVTEVREAITHIMEGGERAFRLRKEKYGSSGTVMSLPQVLVLPQQGPFTPTRIVPTDKGLPADSS